MKQIILSILAFTAFSITIFAQSPEKISYQAIIRDYDNNLVKEQIIGMQISILENTTPVYVETHYASTNENGLVTIEIGTGESSDDFTTIDWADGTYFIKTETDLEGGTNYTITGTSQLLSVPYALHSKTAEIALIDNIDDADADPLNEIQDISISGHELSITDGSTITLPDEVDDLDADPANEIQDLLLSNHILTITENNTPTQIDLSVYENLWLQTLEYLEYEGGVKIGEATTCNDASKGTMRYNPTLNVMEFCDGTQWRNAFGDPPPTPILGISNANLNFGLETNTMQTEIQNVGDGTLTWTASENIDWISVSPLSGTSTGEINTLTVNIDRTLLSSGVHTEYILLTTNNGNFNIAVTAEMIEYLEPIACLDVSPQNGSIVTNFTFDASCSYDNNTPTQQLQYKWDYDGDGNWDTEYTAEAIVNYSYNTPGAYNTSVIVQNEAGKTDTIAQSILVGDHEGFENGLPTADGWSTGGTAVWYFSAYANTGAYSLKNGFVPDAGDSSWVQKTVTGPMLVKFKVSHGTDNHLYEGYFYIDDMQVDKFEGFPSFYQRTYQIPEGEHTIMWLVKDGYFDNNCMFIDDVEFIPIAP